jgi:hypothetical protein
MCLFFFVQAVRRLTFFSLCNAERRLFAAGWRERTKKRGERVWKYDDEVFIRVEKRKKKGKKETWLRKEN